jgi:hypothetical protein
MIQWLKFVMLTSLAMNTLRNILFCASQMILNLASSSRESRPNYPFYRKQYGMPLSVPQAHYGPVSVMHHWSGQHAHCAPKQ